MGETALVDTTAHVLLFNPDGCKWQHTDSGASNVRLFHNPAQDTYRIVGNDKNNGRLVVNCAVVRGMKYQRARDTFHQWRDAQHQVYGLNFFRTNDANAFGSAIEQVLAKLASASGFQPPPSQQQQPPRMIAAAPVVQPASNYQPSSAAHMVTGEYVQPRAASAVSMRSDQTARTNGAAMQNGSLHEARFQSSSDDSVKGHFRSTPPIDPRQSSQLQSSVMNRASPDQPPQAVKSTSDASHVSVPPPPPLVPSNKSTTTGQQRLSRPTQRAPSADAPPQTNGVQSDDDSDTPQSGFAAQLRAARKKHIRASSTLDNQRSGAVENRTSVASETGGGGIDMMSDLQRVLASRRRAQESGGDNATDQSTVPYDSATGPRFKTSVTSQDQPAPASNSTLPGYATIRKNSQPSVNAAPPSKSGGTAGSGSVSRADLEAFKRELLMEFRREVQQLKNEVIEALRAASNRA